MVLISREFSWWRNGLGLAACMVIIPIALIVKLIAMPFERPAKRTPEDVANRLRAFLGDEEDNGYWDAFVHVPIANPELEVIRRRAAAIPNWQAPEGRAELERLLQEAELLQ